MLQLSETHKIYIKNITIVPGQHNRNVIYGSDLEGNEVFNSHLLSQHSNYNQY
jgi:hypothetical protein